MQAVAQATACVGRAMIASKSLPAGQRAVLQAAVAGRGARRRRRRRPRAARGGRAASPAAPAPALDHPPRARLERRSGSANWSPQPRARTRPAARRRRRPARPRRRTPPAPPACAQRAQHVEAMTLPEPSQIERQRRLAVQARHAATPRRSRCRRGTPAPRRRGSARACRPSTCRPRRRARLEVVARVAGIVVGAREAHRQRGRRLGLDRQVGEHVAHQRLVGQHACRRRCGARRATSPARRAARIPAAAPITQSRRVWLTISMIVGTPRPGSPTIRAHAPRNSTSEDALERLPSLSFRRWIWKPSLLRAVGQDRAAARST